MSQTTNILTFAAAALVVTGIGATAAHIGLNSPGTQLLQNHNPDAHAADPIPHAADAHLRDFANSFILALNAMRTQTDHKKPNQEFGPVALQHEAAKLGDTSPVVAGFLAADSTLTAMAEAEQVAHIHQRPIDGVDIDQMPAPSRALHALHLGPTTSNSRPFAVVVGTPHRYPLRPAGTEWVDLTVYVGQISPDGSTLLAYERLNEAESTKQIEAIQDWRVIYSVPESH